MYPGHPLDILTEDREREREHRVSYKWTIERLCYIEREDTSFEMTPHVSDIRKKKKKGILHKRNVLFVEVTEMDE